jgi:hypothetical protein
MPQYLFAIPYEYFCYLTTIVNTIVINIFISNTAARVVNPSLFRPVPRPVPRTAPRPLGFHQAGWEKPLHV